MAEGAEGAVRRDGAQRRLAVRTLFKALQGCGYLSREFYTAKQRLQLPGYEFAQTPGQCRQKQ